MGRKGGHRQHEIEQLEKLRVVGVGCVYCCLEPSTTPHKLSFLTPSTRAPFVSRFGGNCDDLPFWSIGIPTRGLGGATSRQTPADKQAHVTVVGSIVCE